MAEQRSKGWYVIVWAAGAALVLGILAFSLQPKFFAAKVWNSDDLYAAIEPSIDIDLGHGPVAHPAAGSNDIGIHLHPEQHIHRAAETIELVWNITKDYRWPDGVLKSVYLINDDFPGPTVEIGSGDELLISVHNSLENESVAIHWFGLEVENDTDGVPELTQCAIVPQSSFTYRFQMPYGRHGTFWYHSHFDGQRSDGLYGAFVVHERAKPGHFNAMATRRTDIEHEQMLLIGDWYHRAANDVIQAYNDQAYFGAEPVPDSILLNGKGYFSCLKASISQRHACKAIRVPHLTLPSRVTLRVVNVGSLTGFTISTIGYSMTIKQIDGHDIVQHSATRKVGTVYPGQRIDLILERDENQSYEPAWCTIALDRERMQYPNDALTSTQQFPIAPDLELDVGARSSLSTSSPAPVPCVDAMAINSTDCLAEHFVERVDEVIALYIDTVHDARPVATVNGTSWRPAPAWASALVANNGSHKIDCPAPLIVRVPRGSCVDLTISNLDDFGNVLHLHGHTFYILSITTLHGGPGTGDVRLERPAMVALRDSVYVPGHARVVLRFKAEHLGSWLLRSTISWHEAIGMRMIIEVSDGERRAPGAANNAE